MKKLLNNPHVLAFISVLCWAPTFTLVKWTSPHFSPESLAFLRYALAGLLLAAILFMTKTPFPEKKDLVWFALSALCGYSLYLIIFNYGAPMVSSATSSVIIALAPVFTDLFASVFFNEKLKRVQWVAVAIEFLGIIVLALGKSGFTVNQGILWLLFSALLMGLYNIIQRRLSHKYQSLQISAYSIIFGVLELFWCAPKAINQLRVAPPVAVWSMVFMGVFASALAYVTWIKALACAEKTSEVVNYSFITPFFATAFGFLYNGEVPTLPVLIGGLLILTGAFIFSKNK